MQVVRWLCHVRVSTMCTILQLAANSWCQPVGLSPWHSSNVHRLARANFTALQICMHEAYNPRAWQDVRVSPIEDIGLCVTSQT